MLLTMTTHEHNSQPFFVTLVAGAISSVGYGVSLFAIGILWLLPSAVPALPPQVPTQIPIKSKRKLIESRRRSVPSVLPSTGTHRPPITSSISSSSQSSPGSPRTPSSRRVYFADSPIIEIPPLRIKRPLVPDELRKDCCESFPGLTSVIPLDASPRSSSSTLVHICLTSTTSRIPDVVLEPESESSRANNRPVLAMTPRLPSRIKDTWTRKVSGSKPDQVVTDSGGEATHSDEPSCSPSVAGPSTTRQRSKRRTASLGFAWPISKSKALPELIVVSTSTSSSPKPSPSALPTSNMSFSKPVNTCTPSAISSLVRTTKQQRRASAPIRERTQPYSYPYFATPPIAGDQHPTVASAANEVGSSGTSLRRNTTSKSLDLDRESTDLQRRRQNAAAQAALGLGPRRPQQRRATCEGLALAA